jgi:NTE family protein
VANVGLVLSGGGARAAYQVGAIRALSELWGEKTSPFRVLAGISAGAINSVALGIGADDFSATAERLADTWMSLTPDTVYRTDVPKLATLGMRWVKDLTTGGFLGRSRVNYLLDTSPLRALLTGVLDVSRLAQNVRSRLVRGIAISATNYLTGATVTFFDGAPNIEPWARGGRIATRQPIGIDHVLASAAIPIFFPPIWINGTPYGDGGVRMTTPISPAIHLGAEKILTIGIRYYRTVEQTVAMNRDIVADSLSVSEIGGVLLNAVFLDSLDSDMERLERMNRTLAFVPEPERRRLPESLRRIPALALRPSKDLGRLAADQYEKFPVMLRHLLRGIGASGDTGWDLLSYLAFQPGYVGKLIELGYEDTLARRGEIQAFFEQPAEDLAPPSMLPPPMEASGTRG